MKAILILSVLTITACAVPRGYQQQSWASMPVEQAAAVCRNEVQANVTTSQHLCMDAKGWKPVY